MNDKISQPFENTAQIKEARNQINSAKASEPPLCATTEKKELTNQVPSLPPTTDFGMSGAIANEEA
ncbi:MAG: hypothetical protein P8P30_10095 [Rickettsiales bacterium]|nr:hypothetical protein [Rickettsiales bacterium]